MKWPWSKPAPVRELPRAGRRYIRRLQDRITVLEREIEILKAQREAQWQRAEHNENMLAVAIARPIEVQVSGGAAQPHPQWDTFAAMMENEKEGPDPEAVEAMDQVAKKANEIWGDELTMEELAERGTKLCDPL